MANIHMDVFATRELETQFSVTYNIMADALLSLAKAVDDSVGATWIAPAADRFQFEFHTWAGSMQSQLAHLSDLSAALARELTEWETTASQL